MKNRSKKQPLVKKKEFRFHKTEVTKKEKKKSKGWHPVYVFLERGNIYIYVTLTHSDKVENMIVIKLRKNPNPHDKSDAYYVAEVKEDTKDRFGRRRDNWKMDELDDKDIRNIKKR